MKKILNKIKKFNFQKYIKNYSIFNPNDTFQRRHLGSENEASEMLKTLNLNNLEELIEKTIPKKIRNTKELDLGDKEERGEYELLLELKEIASKNDLKMNLIGLGYNECIIPNVILRNVLEDPAFYTPYTPYQAEISQGRLECLLNFQTMIKDLTGMDIANAGLLDESTSAAEAMGMSHGHNERFYLIKSKQ
jgi:glycine dehydrogenase